jgi:glutaredoxin
VRQMLELFQTEWCPASRRVRQRLTVLGLDYINRQVPVEREARTTLREATGFDTIPALLLENGSAVVGEENILVYLSEHFVEPLEAETHQQKAARARRRYLEEECQARNRLRAQRKTTLPFDEAIERVREGLKSEGFGVLCEIDVQATLKKKLGIDGEPYTLLGACNPMLAHQALDAEPELGALLPCNVV